MSTARHGSDVSSAGFTVVWIGWMYCALFCGVMLGIIIGIAIGVFAR